VSHPMGGGDASLALVISEPMLRELARRLAFFVTAVRSHFDRTAYGSMRAPNCLWRSFGTAFVQKIAEPLEAESLAVTLVQRALGPRHRIPSAARSPTRFQGRTTD
jgi:AraC family transcriptional regulator